MQQERAAFTHARLGTETVSARLGLDRARLSGMVGRLEAVSPEAVLARGYALVQDAQGKPVTTASGRPRGGAITLRFADGTRQGRLDPLGTQKKEQGDLGLLERALHSHSRMPVCLGFRFWPVVPTRLRPSQLKRRPRRVSRRRTSHRA